MTPGLFLVPKRGCHFQDDSAAENDLLDVIRTSKIKTDIDFFNQVF